MRKKLIIYLIVVIVLSLLAYGFWAGKNDNKDENSDSSCPFVFAEESNFKLILDKCTKTVGFENGVEVDNGTFSSSDISIESKNGIKKVFKLDQPIFSDNNLSSQGIQATQDGNYLFLDQGTWVVRSMDIFSLRDGKHTQINYHGIPVLINNKYLVFETISSIYDDVHPEIDQSGATDITMLRLSDFNAKRMALGTSDIDFHLKIDSVDGLKMRENKQFINILDGDLVIEKVLWKDPKYIDKGVVNTEEYYSADNFIFKFESLDEDQTTDLNDGVGIKGDLDNVNVKLNIKNKDDCANNSGTWYETDKTCEINSLVGDSCTSRGGVFNECNSACRHDPEASICTMQCVLTCSFK